MAFWSEKSKTRVEILLAQGKREGWAARPPSEIALSVGLRLRGTPYGAPVPAVPERLAADIDVLDCMTFVEAVVALTRLICAGCDDPQAFPPALRFVRYRGGRIRGYASRLHYASDWLGDNARRGVVRLLSGILGGLPFPKTFSFVTDHPDRYPPLARGATFRRLRGTERRLTRERRLYLPAFLLAAAEKSIPAGAILAFTTDQAGLDVLHMGFAVRRRGCLRILHASRPAGRVEISRDPLLRYLSRHPAMTGAMVAEIVGPGPMPLPGGAKAFPA